MAQRTQIDVAGTLSAIGELCYKSADAIKNNIGRTLEMITRRNALGLLAATPLAASPQSKAFAAALSRRGALRSPTCSVARCR